MAFKYWKILSAISSRFILTVHGFLLVWQVVVVKKNTHYWMLLIGLLLLYLEIVVTLTVTRKGEWKWFSPMVFLYLTSAIPSVFFLELHFLEIRALMVNSTNTEDVIQVLHFVPSFQWLDALEQVMILVLVIGRWLMPKGEISRDQLSELLLTYIGLGADILDILLLIKDPSVDTNWNVAVVALCLFSWATLQFPLVLTQTGSSPTQGAQNEYETQSAPGMKERCASSCCTNEIWSLLIAVGMQDGPFLIFRLYLAIKERMLNEMMIFYICKNILTVSLEIYRIIAVHCVDSKHRNN
ncbi:transmembrane protein 26-like [Hyla sarda]|uniref:transmembrane protein 26-like n=1 Tax=Hyla sarda TaxID=327740 RepID=UPI0024C40E30|nr:transmembrane protein 26-like [Hyla sarda]